ncbi:MAG TPA: MmgE/PrpD family protein, partial [Burkholderiales bacterium]|nr:MmgE/PrpD family protein [Burkholderiales bacterium]
MTKKTGLPVTSIAEVLAEQAAAVAAGTIPEGVRRRAEELLVDVVGLCVAARRTEYVKAVIGGLDASGSCTAIGHETTYGPEQAALVNGTAAHGEDFDDTFEGGPVHSSAVVAPAVLAACERFGRDGRAALAGMVTGVETLCRLSMVIPKAIHKAGFHPTSVLGTMGATLGASVAMGLDRRQT